jgi:5'-nucleotidase
MRVPTPRPRAGRLLSMFGLMVAVLLAVPAGLMAARPGPAVDIQILDISDWHAQLDPNDIFGVGRVGGAAYLSTYFKADRTANPNTLTVTAGDAFGASPPLSGFFDEVPGVLAQRMMGIDVDTFGNHNFDRGTDHLQRMIDLAGSPTSQDHPGEPFGYVSANLRNRDANLEGVKDFEIFTVGGVKVAVIGITNPEAHTLVFPGSMGTIEVTDPVPAANRARAAARAAGARIFIAITHLGVTGFDAAGNPTGPVIDFANEVGGFHVIFGDHTDVQYSGIINNTLVVENRSKGVSYSRTNLRIQPDNGRLISRSNTFITPLSSVTPDPAIEEMLQPYRDELAERFDEKIAVATGRFPRGGNIERRQEVAIGDLIAESMRSAYETQLALTNGGGIRSPLPSSYVPQDTTLDRTDPPPYDLVVGDPYTVLPFGNVVVTRHVTGSQLWDALEHGVAAVAADGSSTNGRFPQIAGFRFVFDSRLAVGSRVLAVTLPDGTPIPDDGTSYSLALPDFVNAGGDGYTMFQDEHGVTRDLMATVMLEHIRSLGTVSPTVDGRIRNCATATPPCP